jgi:hypothetical protein
MVMVRVNTHCKEHTSPEIVLKNRRKYLKARKIHKRGTRVRVEGEFIFLDGQSVEDSV